MPVFKLWLLGLLGSVCFFQPCLSAFLPLCVLLASFRRFELPLIVLGAVVVSGFMQLLDLRDSALDLVDRAREWKVSRSFLYSSKIESEGCTALINRSLPVAYTWAEPLPFKEIKTQQQALFPSREIKTKMQYPCGLRTSKTQSRQNPKTLKVHEKWRSAILFGDRTGFDRELIQKAQFLGIAHLFVFSGFHLGVIVFLIFFLLTQVLGRFNPCWFRFSVRSMIHLVPPLLAATFLSLQSSSLSLTRCALAAAGFWILEILFPSLRRLPRSEVFCLFAIFVLIWNPLYAFHLGYLLSYGICWVLMSCSEESRLKSWSMPGLVMAVIGSQSLLSLFYAETSLFSLLFNLYFGALFSFIVFPSLFIFHHTSNTLLSWVESQIHIFFRISQDFDFQSSSHWGSLSLLFFTLYFFLSSKSLKLVAFVICSMFLFVVPPLNLLSLKKGPYELSFEALDVGQGDAFLIQSNGKNVLVDGGRGVYLKPKLERRGVRKIDLWILTHFDEDHMGFFAQMARNYEIENLWLPKWDTSSKTARIRRQTGGSSKLKLLQWESARSFPLGPFDLECSAYASGRFKVRNNDSIHCELRRGSRVLIVLSGDLVASGERRHLRAKSSLRSRADLMVAGHHGSKTSSSNDWLAHYQPHFAVFSLGRGNSYGFPHPYVLDRFKRWNATIRRTDALGDIRFLWKQKSVD